MPADSTRSRSTSARVRALPWLAILRAGALIERRRRSLSREERGRLSALLRRSRGRRTRLSAEEREELQGLMVKLDVAGIWSELVRLAKALRPRGAGGPT